ncbi:MAG: hypothetical protein HUJ27_15970 [Rhodobacteraceae bacterium]|nr:hypothetical protein [Paracoccaceae bacterium]
MSEAKLIDGRLQAGVWTGRFTGPRTDVEVLHDGEPISGAEVSDASSGEWTLSIQVPMERLGDGVQVFILRDTRSGQILGHFTLTAETGDHADLRAEVDLLRAELDLLRRAFRRLLTKGD